MYELLGIGYGFMIFMFFWMKSCVDNYKVIDCNVLDSNEKYFVVEAILSDQRLFRDKDKFVHKKLLCYYDYNTFIVKHYGNEKTVLGIDKSIIESCVLNSKKVY